ncbi:BON domain-containing protein [Pedosphaera parvula]|uniref:Transport-associated protein n=1 Tax=Pedosphaera parvula (strain Ellin514) TaxID=320771 RepID=B9XJE9_PEDPL|nr:BON domain-containing protein [Pedosphaera parvula]EEF60010.1 transport-associated protein [Pedosphaera parvula Ellin514]
MKDTTAKKLESVKVFGVIAFLSALPFVAATGCNKDNQTASSVDTNTVVVTPTDRTVGEAVDDTTLTANVKKALSNNTEYKFSDVKVATMKGTVQLSGFVDTAAQKSAAGDIAKAVPNVKEVVNNITLKQ